MHEVIDTSAKMKINKSNVLFIHNRDDENGTLLEIKTSLLVVTTTTTSQTIILSECLNLFYGNPQQKFRYNAGLQWCAAEETNLK